jgi:hypothetical protein
MDANLILYWLEKGIVKKEVIGIAKALAEF